MRLRNQLFARSQASRQPQWKLSDLWCRPNFGGSEPPCMISRTVTDHWRFKEPFPQHISDSCHSAVPPVPGMATSRGVLGSLQVCTAGGREIRHPLSSTLTVAQLKGNLRARLETPVAYLRLLHGMEELLDDWVLMEHGVSNGAILTQVTSWLPFGLFGFDSHHQNFCPAGRNTTATVHVDIRDDGTFHIRVMETEITSLMQGPNWDPYLEGAAFSQQYEGSVRVGEGSQLIFSVSHCDRRGIFVVEEPIELRGELCQDASEVKLEIPFAAGACNEGRAGSKWLTVSQNHVPQIDDSPDSSLRARRFLRLPATPQQSRLRRVLSRAFGCFSRPE